MSPRAIDGSGLDVVRLDAMERVPEPELMEDEAQVRAYAEADFSAPHQHFVELFRERFARANPRAVLDLGCGPGDVSRRFARAYPRCRVVGIDGSRPMLEAGRALNARESIAGRVDLRLGRLPEADLGGMRFDTLISNSLLHHLADPAALWDALAGNAEPGAVVFVMDLLRPDTPARANALVDLYARGEPEILRHDFRASLHAAYRPDEVEAQIARSGLSKLTVEIVSDRHLVVHGRLEGVRAD